HTASGRRVLGGGGITPDIDVTADSLAAPVAEVERRALALRFANRWADAHPETKNDPRVTDAMWHGFVEFAGTDPAKLPASEGESARPRREQALRREIAR